VEDKFSEDEMRRPTPRCAVPLESAKAIAGSLARRGPL
jgi:hypothetical protein